MKTWTAAAASQSAYALGEGPVWDAHRERLLWVDIAAVAVHLGHISAGDRVVEDSARHIDRTVGAVARSADGRLPLAAVRYGTIVPIMVP